MKQKLFQIHDQTAMQVGGPIMAASRAEAVIRQFAELLADKTSLPGKYPEDFILLELGEQDLTSGEITPCDPKTIYTGRVFLRQQAHAAAKADGGSLESAANNNGAAESSEPPPALVDTPRATHSLRERGGAGYHISG